MKITFFLLLIAFLQISAATYSQSTKLDLNYENIKLSELLDKIEKTSGYRFFYDSETIDLSKVISVNMKDSNIQDVLEEVFGSDFSYEMVDSHIIILKDKKNDLAGMAIKQQSNIKGKVNDLSGSPLPGVTVVVKGTTHGTITDANGNYSLINIPGNAALIFSFVGMKTQEIVVSEKTTINVVMQEETVGIEEVVAIGYGTTQKRDLTGSVASVNANDLKSSVLTTPDQALQGRIAGVQVQTASHAPGGGISVQVRGTSSLSADGQPLYVVDGFPISNEYSSASSVDGIVGISQNPLNSIDPSNIESIEVLKDASSTAIYGARGANGVVLITTKKGKTGKATVSFESSTSVDSPSKYLHFLNAEEWGDSC